MRLTLLMVGFLLPLKAIPQEKIINRFTLEECIEYALKHNEEYLNAGLEASAQETFVGEVLSDGLPQVSGEINLINNFRVQTSFIPAIFFDPNAGDDDFVPVQFQTQYNGGASVTFSQLILDGAYFLGLKAARTFTQLSAKDFIKSKIDLKADVSKAYYSVLVFKEGLELIKNNYQRIDTLLKETQLLFENGFAEKIDINRLKVEHNNLKTEMENMERSLIASYLVLKFQVSMPDNEELVLTEDLSQITFDLNAEDLSKFTYEDRIEYSTLNTGLELAHMDLKNIRLGYLPKLDGFATFGANAGTGSWGNLFAVGDNWFTYGLYGFSLSVPVFDGFRKSNQMQKRKIIINQRENQKQRLEKAIDMEISTARISLENSVARMSTQKENMGLAEEVFEISRAKYQQGLGSNLEVIEAENSYKTSQTNYYNALYEALVAKIDYQKALGRLN